MLKVNAYYYWFAMVLVALSMELAQGLLQTTRVASIYNAIANGLGVLLALLFIMIMTRYRRI